MEVNFQYTLALYESKWSASGFGRFTPGKIDYCIHRIRSCGIKIGVDVVAKR